MYSELYGALSGPQMLPQGGLHVKDGQRDRAQDFPAFHS